MTSGRTHLTTSLLRSRPACSSPDRDLPGSTVEPGPPPFEPPRERTMPMADVVIELLKAHFRQLRLPTIGQEFEKLARDAASGNQTFVQFLLSLTELELAARAANAIGARIKNADFPFEKDFDTFDFTALPGLSKPKVLELGRCEWIEQKSNCCLIGSHGTGKTHISIGLGLAACRAGLRVEFFTAAELVSRLEKEQKQYTLDRFLRQVRVHTPIDNCKTAEIPGFANHERCSMGF